MHQAGLYKLQGFSETNQQAVLNTLCPHTLYPYACRVITDLVADGGFPPLVLQPINFEQIYAQRLEEMNAKQNTGGNDDIEVQGNA